MESCSGKALDCSQNINRRDCNRCEEVHQLCEEFNRRKDLYVDASRKTANELTFEELIDERFRFAASTSIRPLDRAEVVLRRRQEAIRRQQVVEAFVERVNTSMEVQFARKWEALQERIRQLKSDRPDGAATPRS